MKTDCHDCCYPKIIDSQHCGCCEGVEAITPLSTVNRPGLSQLSYRIGSHSSFLQTMLARLSNKDYPQLAGLTTRDADDAAIALLDGWATVADVLTFYQERIANEAYLRCATERRSILELARLVGYKLRPGVSASVFLAYTIDENTQEETTIPAGSRVQSVPGPDELPQAFETIEAIKARATWNNLTPRMSRPQTYASITTDSPDSTVQTPRVYLKGINTNLKANDPLLIGIDDNTPQLSYVIDVIPDALADHTLVTLRLNEKSGSLKDASSTDAIFNDVDLIKELTQAPSIQRRNSKQLPRALSEQFTARTNAGYAIASAFSPKLSKTLPTAAANATLTDSGTLKVYALRVKASLFGHNLPLPACPKGADSLSLLCCMPDISSEPVISFTVTKSDSAKVTGSSFKMDVGDGVSANNILALDAEYKEIKKASWVTVDDTVFKVDAVTSATLGGLLEGDLSFFSTCPAITLTSNSSAGAGASIGEATKIKATTLVLNAAWKDDNTKNDVLRKSVFYGQSEALELAEEPIETPVCGGANDLLELDGFYEGLESGRWVIVSGEREIAGTKGVKFSELAMLSSVTQNISIDTSVKGEENIRPGEKIHTYIKLANELAYCFKRDSVSIYGNVVKADHGETRNEVLGSGNGSKALQTFELKQSPLTHVSASNPTGVDSSLNIFVNNIRWQETDSLAGLQANDRNFITTTDDDNKTSITFGNGKQGSRLPTGVENIRAEYRNGIGKGGNVNARQISMLVTKPLGAKEVINPLRASGGADRESRDQARMSAPLAVMALDRLVSVRDYKDFSRLYAGIGKSIAVEISDGHKQLVHVTVAGADDIPIDETSDLFLNLRQALHDFGDPFQPLQLAIRELMLIVISAKVKIQADYQWEPVVTELRTALLDALGFERRELGQDVVLSEVISVMQAVPGVTYVDVDNFGGIPEKINENGGRRLLTPDEIAESVTCFSTQWSQDDMASWCQLGGEHEQENECMDYKNCKKYGDVTQTRGVSQRLRVNLAALEGEVIRPAQLAFLTPDVADTLILNQIK